MSNNHTIEEDINIWAYKTHSPSKPDIAVTEQARYPDDLDKQATWPSSVGLSAAISTADMMISQEQDPDIGMSLNFGIAVWSPWGLFMPANAKGYIDPGPFSPEPSVWAQKLVSRALQSSDILGTAITTPANSGYNKGAHFNYAPCVPYDVSATGYRNSHRQYGAIAINRAAQSYPLSLTFPSVPYNYSGPVKTLVEQVNSDAGITATVQNLSAVYGTVTTTLGPYGVYNFTVLALGAHSAKPRNHGHKWQHSKG